MKLVLFSTDGYPKNVETNKKLLKLLDTQALITFIPAGPDAKKEGFKFFAKWFRKWGYTKFHFFDPEDSDETALKTALNSDAIYLSGGNPYTFLHRILKRDLKAKLQDFAVQDKLLMGSSAGAMVLGPSVGQTVLFKGIRNQFSVDKEQGLSLTDFEFFPHYGTKGFFKNPQTVDRDLIKRVNQTGKKIIACKEGEGLIVNGSKLIKIGKPRWFQPN